MRICSIVCVLAGLSLARPALGQEPSALAGRFLVTGFVLDSITGRPVPMATVSFRSSRRVVFTDVSGRFIVDATPAVDRVTVRQIGYATVSFKVTVNERMAPLAIRLVPDPVPLKVITARARRDNRYTIEGTIVDSITGRPVPRVVLWFQGSGGTAVTDTLGHYVYDRAQAGFEDVVVDVLGYERRRANRKVSEPWQRLDFALQPDPIVLQGIVALAERLQHVSVHSAGFKHDFSERDFARSGRPAVADFMQWNQAYRPPHATRVTENGTVVRQLPCAYSSVISMSAFARPLYGVPARGDSNVTMRPVAESGIASEGGGIDSVIVNGRFVVGGERGRVPVERSDFYRAIFVRDFRCGGVSSVIMFTKSYLRDAFHGRRGQKLISRDSLEALLAAADTLR